MLLTRRARGRDAVPTSSLADIAFLLLIFFLVTTVFDDVLDALLTAGARRVSLQLLDP